MSMTIDVADVRIVFIYQRLNFNWTYEDLEISLSKNRQEKGAAASGQVEGGLCQTQKRPQRRPF